MANATDPRILNARKTQTILAHVLRGVDQATATGPRDAADGADGWTTLDVLCHLRDFEQIWQARAELMLAEENPKLPALDPHGLAEQNDYAHQELATVWAERTHLRQQTAAFLEGLSDEQWNRTGIHPLRGELTLGAMSLQLTTHDIDHIEQIVRILDGAEG